VEAFYQFTAGDSVALCSPIVDARPTEFQIFESLPERKGRRLVSFGAGFVVQAAIVTCLLLLTFFLTPEIAQVYNKPQFISLQLSPSLPAVLRPRVRLPQPLPRLTEPEPRPEQIVAPKVMEVKPALKAPVLRAEPKKLPEIPAVVPARPREEPKVGVLEARNIAPSNGPKMKRPGIRTDMFDGSSAPATVKRPSSQVQTGGFGSPEGFKGNAQGGSTGNVAKLGSFDLPSGPGYGNGSGGAKGVRGTVASAGFGSGIATAGGGGGAGGTGPGGSGRGGVREGAFGEVRAAAPSASHVARAPSSSSAAKAVEILFKPNPVYTEEARRAHVEGEVLLAVVFKASGEISVLRVVAGLGHGLDEAAVHAAQQIRFKPAQRDGQPIDLPATLHIVFQLAS
jgi:TonB family protein